MESSPNSLQQALAAYQSGNFPQAEHFCRLILESPPDQSGIIDKALTDNPGSATTYLLTGNIFLQLGKNAEAVLCFERVLKLDPSNSGAMANQAFALNGLKRHDDAISVCNRALILNPDCKIALMNRAVSLGCLDRHAEALECHDRALGIDSQDASVLRNRGTTLFNLRRFDEAVLSYSMALKINPSDPETLTSYGLALMKLGRYDEALASYGKAIASHPTFGGAIWNDTLCRLLLGQFNFPPERLAWLWSKGYWGRKAPGLSCPVWTGKEDLRGKSILLHEDQGLGDAIQFVRYLPWLAQKGAVVYLGVVPPLKHLMARIPGVAQVLVSDDPCPTVDFQCALSSLPFAFGTTVRTIPAQIPYVSVEQEAVASWRAKLAGGDEKLVGLCWRGNPNYKDDEARSIELSRLASLLSVPGIRFVSLQKELTDVELPITTLSRFVHPGTDFTSTAEIVAALDLIISVDTVWAHCAGAMGKPVWVLVPFVPYWVWSIGREDSPWYPTARLFRQSEIGNWKEVIPKVKEALDSWRATREAGKS